MSKIKFYGYKKCGTCRKAEDSLKKAKKDYEFIDITLNPPSASELKKFITASGVELKKIFNTSGIQYKELNIKEKLPSMSEDQIIKMLAQNGRLIKRPIVVNDKKVTVGFNDEFSKEWKK